jgi:hypothetical protein
MNSLHSVPIPWKTLCVCLSASCLALLVAYIFMVNSLTSGAYLMKSYEKQINKLSDQNRVLETSFAESNFLGQTQQDAQQLGFEKTSSVTYVQVADTSLARAR